MDNIGKAVLSSIVEAHLKNGLTWYNILCFSMLHARICYFWRLSRLIWSQNCINNRCQRRSLLIFFFGQFCTWQIIAEFAESSIDKNESLHLQVRREVNYYNKKSFSAFRIMKFARIEIRHIGMGCH